jgi:hypothetical protein
MINKYNLTFNNSKKLNKIHPNHTDTVVEFIATKTYD